MPKIMGLYMAHHQFQIEAGNINIHFGTEWSFHQWPKIQLDILDDLFAFWNILIDQMQCDDVRYPLM